MTPIEGAEFGGCYLLILGHEINMSKLNAMLEPLLMIFLAILVLAFLLALYMPLFQLGEWV